jgi:hypothetical protein
MSAQGTSPPGVDDHPGLRTGAGFFERGKNVGVVLCPGAVLEPDFRAAEPFPINPDEDIQRSVLTGFQLVDGGRVVPPRKLGAVGIAAGREDRPDPLKGGLEGRAQQDLAVDRALSRAEFLQTGLEGAEILQLLAVEPDQVVAVVVARQSLPEGIAVPVRMTDFDSDGRIGLEQED